MSGHIRIIVFCLALLSFVPGFGQSKNPSSKKKLPNSALSTKQSNRPSYSVFAGTMVELSWPEVKEAAEAGSIVLLPVGVIEEHGPHMSLGPDTYEAYERCVILKRKLQDRKIRAVVAPPIYWGIMQKHETGAYPGSFTVSPETMKGLLHDVFSDLQSWGFSRIYVINHHGDRVHRQTLAAAMTDARENLGIDFYEEKRNGPPEQALLYKGDKAPYTPDFHAGMSETAEMVTFFPGEVNVALAKKLKPQSTFHPLGYVGDPANYESFNAAAAITMDTEVDDLAQWARSRPVQK